DFVARLLAGASGLAITSTFDVDRLLWVPGAKTYFLPSPALAPLSLDWIAQEAARILSRQLRFSAYAYAERRHAVLTERTAWKQVVFRLCDGEHLSADRHLV